MEKRLPSLLAGCAALTLSAWPAAAQSSGSATTDAIRARGSLVCGTSADLPGFAMLDSNGRCTGRCTDFCRAGPGPCGNDFAGLPELISKGSLGPVVRKGDDRFFGLVRRTQNALHLAEEFGITRRSVDSFRNDPRPDMQRLPGVTGDFGRDMGAPRERAVNVIRQVGSYAEIWDRNVAPLGLPRGRNQLYIQGGLRYVPPIR